MLTVTAAFWAIGWATAPARRLYPFVPTPTSTAPCGAVSRLPSGFTFSGPHGPIATGWPWRPGACDDDDSGGAGVVGSGAEGPAAGAVSTGSSASAGPANN